MNKNQKRIILCAMLVFLFTLIAWIAFGGEVFTKTQILVESKDPLFGWTNRRWVNKFVWGLDLSLLIDVLTVTISAIFLFFFRTKKYAAEVS